MADITSLGAFELGKLAMRGKISATEIVESYLKRIEAINPSINAITDIQAERALEEAARLDAKRRNTRCAGPLQGVPFTIKSSIAAEGCLQECGTKLRQGVRAERDAKLVHWLKLYGAIVIGTTNVPEFLMAYETDNAMYGRTNSPLDPNYTPGGSSGGCSAAVSAGCSAGSFGSDAGGSIRVPAHFCGLYGMKTTPGLISRTGHWPPAGGPFTTLASVGPLAKTAEDLHRLVDITCEYDPLDISAIARVDDIERNYRHPIEIIRDSRVGWFDHAWNTPVTVETRSALMDAVMALHDRGFTVERIEPRGLEPAPKVWRMLFRVCLKTLIEGSVPEGYRLHPLAYDAMVTDQEQEATTHADLLEAWMLQDRMRVKLHELMRKYHLLLCPVAAVPAFRHGERSWSIDGDKVTYPDAFVYSQVFNVLGVPAATAPVGQSADGLPIGVQIVGRPHEDYVVTTVVEELAAGLGRK